MSHEKSELRRRLRNTLAGIARDELLARSARACHLLEAQAEFRDAQVIMVFLSLPHELDTTALVLSAWQAGKRVLAPKVNWEQRRMLPTEFRSLTTDVVQSDLGLREPASGSPVPVSDIDLLIVPGLGFDRSGNRLGRGRGFYDRFLDHRDLRAISCAMGLEEQLLDEIPADVRDHPVDMLVTDKTVLRFVRR